MCGKPNFGCFSQIWLYAVSMARPTLSSSEKSPLHIRNNDSSVIVPTKGNQEKTQTGHLERRKKKLRLGRMEASHRYFFPREWKKKKNVFLLHNRLNQMLEMRSKYHIASTVPGQELECGREMLTVTRRHQQQTVTLFQTQFRFQ